MFSRHDQLNQIAYQNHPRQHCRIDRNCSDCSDRSDGSDCIDCSDCSNATTAAAAPTAATAAIAANAATGNATRDWMEIHWFYNALWQHHVF